MQYAIGNAIVCFLHSEYTLPEPGCCDLCISLHTSDGFLHHVEYIANVVFSLQMSFYVYLLYKHMKFD